MILDPTTRSPQNHQASNDHHQRHPPAPQLDARAVDPNLTSKSK